MNRIAVVGQTPPPFGGQTLMFGRLLDGQYEGVTLVHVPMAFSRSLADMGHFRISKVFELVRVVGRIVKARVVDGAVILYYPPAGPFTVPMLRDLVVLIMTRWMYKATIFHFHAGGVSAMYSRLPRLLRPVFRAAYFYPDAAIRTSLSAPEDGRDLRARSEFVVANGIEDVLGHEAPEDSRAILPPLILHVGMLSKPKGIVDLLEACAILRQNGTDFELVLAGPIESQEFSTRLESLISQRDLGNFVRIIGPVSGEDKWQLFRRADIFCYPTCHPGETFGVAAVEAMCFGIPVVASRWRGLAEVIQDGVCGLLTPVNDPQGLAEALQRLLSDPELRSSMGAAGRQRYLFNYRVEQYRNGLQEVFDDVVSNMRGRK